MVDLYADWHRRAVADRWRGEVQSNAVDGSGPSRPAPVVESGEIAVLLERREERGREAGWQAGYEQGVRQGAIQAQHDAADKIAALLESLSSQARSDVSQAGDAAAAAAWHVQQLDRPVSRSRARRAEDLGGAKLAEEAALKTYQRAEEFVQALGLLEVRVREDGLPS